MISLRMILVFIRRLWYKSLGHLLFHFDKCALRKVSSRNIPYLIVTFLFSCGHLSNWTSIFPPSVSCSIGTPVMFSPLSCRLNDLFAHNLHNAVWNLAINQCTKNALSLFRKACFLALQAVDPYLFRKLFRHLMFPSHCSVDSSNSLPSNLEMLKNVVQLFVCSTPASSCRKLLKHFNLCKLCGQYTCTI